MNDTRPARHLKWPDLVWFELDPAQFVARAAAHSDDYPGLAARLMESRRGAWKCDSYLALRQGFAGSVSRTDVPCKDGGELLGVDLDRDGNPIGIEFLGRSCASTEE